MWHWIFTLCASAWKKKNWCVVQRISGTEQWADILTKALDPSPFLQLQFKLVGELLQARGRRNVRPVKDEVLTGPS